MVIGLVGGIAMTPEGELRTDVWVEGDRVVALGESPGRPESVFDVAGAFVGPGLVDLHTHLRDPGQTWKDDLESGARAAAAGGFTAVVAMPNTDPPLDRTEALQALRGRISGLGVTVAPAASLTIGRAGLTAVDLPALFAEGVRVFTDDGDWLADGEVLEELMEMAARRPGAVIAQHAEDRGLSAGGQMHAGKEAERAGLAGIPAEAEHAAVARDLEIAARTGVAYHVQHVSSARTLDVVDDARADGVRVTVEVTPHHLDFDVDSVSGPNFKMYPPLRTRTDRGALLRHLRDGSIDVVATDHAPHTEDEKAVPFSEAPRGVIGLETAASSVWRAVGDPATLFRVMSTNPARLAGLARHGRLLETGSPANLVVFDPHRSWTVESFASRSQNSPYLGMEMAGRVVLTVHEGEMVHSLEGVS